MSSFISDPILPIDMLEAELRQLDRSEGVPEAGVDFRGNKNEKSRTQFLKGRMRLLGACIRARFEGLTSGTGSDATKGVRDDLELELCRAQAQLIEARAEITALRQQKGELRPILAHVLRKTDGELRASIRYAVQHTQDTDEWEAVTEQCYLGGCDMGVYTFPTERDALIFLALLEAAGYRPGPNKACPQCFAEYMRDRI